MQRRMYLVQAVLVGGRRLTQVANRYHESSVT